MGEGHGDHSDSESESEEEDETPIVAAPAPSPPPCCAQHLSIPISNVLTRFTEVYQGEKLDALMQDVYAQFTADDLAGGELGELSPADAQAI